MTTRWTARLVSLLGLLAAAASQAAAPAGRYLLAADTALDTETGLTWERGTPGGIVTLSNATAWCASITTGGLTGWRLPTYKELKTLVDVRASNPALDSTVFSGFSNAMTWSSTADYVTPGVTWAVNFFNGSSVRLAAGTVAAVRCVR